MYDAEQLCVGITSFPEKKGICYPLRSRITIIPIASGEGGVGKSFLTANIGVVLAEMGHTTVVLDMIW